MSGSPNGPLAHADDELMVAALAALVCLIFALGVVGLAIVWLVFG